MWDKLYKAMSELEQNSANIDGFIMHPTVYKLKMLPYTYRDLGYPLGKNNRGWKKWAKKEMNLIKEND